MTPIELLRHLFHYPNTVDDYQLVALVFEEATINKITQELQIPQYIYPSSNFSSGGTIDCHHEYFGLSNICKKCQQGFKNY